MLVTQLHLSVKHTCGVRIYLSSSTLYLLLPLQHQWSVLGKTEASV